MPLEHGPKKIWEWIPVNIDSEADAGGAGLKEFVGNGGLHEDGWYNRNPWKKKLWGKGWKQP